ncbi:MAG: hypothetical protein ACTTGU_08350 [Moraxella sp.]
MSSSKTSLILITLLILTWLGQAIALTVYGDATHNEHYQLDRTIKPLITGGVILYIWHNMHIANSRLAWLGFATLIFANLIYVLATAPTAH